MIEIDKDYTLEHTKERILFSIAISLKRIADALEQPKINSGDIVMPELKPEDISKLEEHWANAGSYEVK